MTYIIAEAGTGHFHVDEKQREELARQYIFEAHLAGANAVKFQLFVPNEPLFCPIEGDEKRWERWNQTLLPLKTWRALVNDAPMGIDVLWSAFQPTALDWLKRLKPKYIKVASRAGALFDTSRFGNTPILLSAEPSNLPPCVRFDVRTYVLKCIPQYPAPIEKCGYDPDFAGLSDHSGTIWPGLDAIAHGAKFLEVHFKIPGVSQGNDDPVCLSTNQLKLLCEARDAFARMH